MRIRGLITFIFLYSIQLIASNSPELKFKYWEKKDGLSSSYINSVEEDADGFIWIGTNRGLNRIVGKSIISYFSIVGDSTSIPDNFIIKLFKDSKDQLWVSSRLGVSVYNKSYDNFTHIASDKDYNGLYALNVIQFCENKSKQLFVATSDYIYIYNEQKSQFKEIIKIPNGEIMDFLIRPDGEIWITVDSNPGLYIYEQKDNCYHLKSEGINQQKFSLISSIIERNDTIFFGTLVGLHAFDVRNNKIIKYINDAPDSNVIKFLELDNNNNIWTCDYTGLKFFTPHNGTFKGYYPTGSPSSIKPNSSGIFQSTQGTYWVYHQPGGIGMDIKNKGFRIFTNSDNTSWHSSSNDFAHLITDQHSRLWIGSSNATIDIFDWDNLSSKSFRCGSKGLPKGTVVNFGKNADHEVLISIYNKGVYKYNERKDHFDRYYFIHNDTVFNELNDVRSITIDKKGRYWLCVHGKGVYCIDGDQYTQYNTENSNLSSDWTNQLLIDHLDNIWVASSWGLSVLKNGHSEFQSYYKSTTQNKGLAENQITCLFQDRNHILWVGTSAGLSKYNYDLNSFESIFPNEYICSIADDNENRIWITTNSNLISYNYKENNKSFFTDKDGINISEYLTGSVLRDTINNELYFGGLDGMVIFKPHLLVYNTQKPNVEFTSLKLFSKEIDYKTNPEIISKAIGKAEEIHLAYFQNVITLGFESNNYIAHSNNQFAYKLEGFDKDWAYVKDIHYATYTNLPPGKYFFKVKSVNNDGVWNDDPKVLIISIIPPWYKRNFVRFLLFLTLLIIVFILIKIRTRHLQVQQIILEDQVEEKTKELQESNGELQAQADYLKELNQRLEERQKKIEDQAIKLKIQSVNLKVANSQLNGLNATKDRLFSVIAHDLLSPFNSILGLTEVFKSAQDDMGEKERVTLAQNIHSSAQRVHSLLQNLLMWSRSQTRSVKFNPQVINLKRIVAEITDLLEDSLYLKNLKCIVKIPGDLELNADIDMLSTIIRNLLSNAVKFSHPDESIIISAIPSKSKVTFSITDKGVGLPPKAAKKIFTDDNVHSKAGTHGEKGSGLGLIICKDFVEKHKGKIWMESDEGKGTTFYFTIPQAT